MSRPISGILPPDSPNSKENSKPMLTPVHTLPTEPVPMQPLVDAELLELGVDPRWIAANARYRRAKTFNRDDVDAAVLECQRVVAMMAKEAKDAKETKETKETDAVQKPVETKTNDGLQSSDDGKSEDSWHPESLYSIPEEFKEQEGNDLKDRDVDSRSLTANMQYWIARITGDLGDLDAAKSERKRGVAMMDTEANAVAEPVKTEMDRSSLSNDEKSETPSRPESIHASPTEFKKHEDDRLNYQAFKRLFQVLIDSHIVPLITDPEFWKTHLQDCTAEECEEFYLAFSNLFLNSDSDKQKWSELFSDRASARSRNLLRFICKHVPQGIVGSHDDKAEDSGQRRTSSIASNDSEIVRQSKNAWDHRPYSYGCGAKGRASGTEDNATESDDSGEFGGVKLDTTFENSDEDGYNASCSESPSETSEASSSKWSSLPYALFPIPTDEPIEARRRSSSPARLQIPNTTRLFQAQQEDDDILRGRRSLRYSPEIPLAFLQLVGPLGTAVKKPQPENEATEAEKSTVTSEEPKALSAHDAEDDDDTGGVRVMFKEKADESTVTSEEPKDLSEPDTEDDADNAGVRIMF